MKLEEFITSQIKEVFILKIIDAKGTILKKHVLKDSYKNINFVIHESSLDNMP